MSFVQSPGLYNRNIVTIEFIGCVIEGLNGSGEYGCEAEIELISVLM